MKKPSARLLGLSLVLAGSLQFGAPSLVFAQEPHSAADIAQGREFFGEGLALRDKGDTAGALEKFKAAHALAGTPISGLELGRAYVAMNKLIEARETFLSVGRIAHRSEETAKSAAARTESARLADELKSRIPRLTVKVIGVTRDSVSVTIDGAAVPTEALAGPRFVNPGGHDVTAKSASGAAATTRVDLAEREVREVELTISPTEGAPPPVVATADAPASASTATPPASAPEESARPRDGQTQRTAALIVGAVGVVGVAVGGALALVAKADDVSASGEAWPQKHDDSVSAAHLADTATVVMGIGAAVAVAGAGILGLLHRKVLFPLARAAARSSCAGASDEPVAVERCPGRSEWFWRRLSGCARD